MPQRDTENRPLDVGSLRFILGLKLKFFRRQKRLSLRELGERAGMSVSYLSEIESGRKYPKPIKLIHLAEALGVSYDELVSLDVDQEFDSLRTVLDSEFVRQFPFHLFGIELEALFGLVADVPGKSAALFETFLELGRTYGVQVEHILFAALRSYQQLRHNYFLDMEQAAAAFRTSEGWTSEESLSADALRDLLVDRYGFSVDEERLAQHPTLHGFRSVFLPTDPPKLLINARLLPSQKAFVYGREIGYQYLGLGERAVTGSWLNVESFGQILNNFKASYFSGALLIDEGALQRELMSFFGRDRWDGAAFLDCMQRFDATPEMFFYRLTQILPEHFGLEEIYFLRFHHMVGTNEFRLTKALNLSHVPVPHGLGLDEHYCRRWPALRLLQEIDRRPAEWPSGRPRVCAQRSRFLNENASFFVIAMSRPLALSEDTNSCVSLGFLLNDAFRKRVRFWNDPGVPQMDVNLTCERCGLEPEECRDRAAPPTLFRGEELRKRQSEALAELLGAARSSTAARRDRST